MDQKNLKNGYNDFRYILKVQDNNECFHKYTSCCGRCCEEGQVYTSYLVFKRIKRCRNPKCINIIGTNNMTGIPARLPKSAGKLR